VSALKRILFVCIGNACRSQMAEAFARIYGSDVLIAASAGLSPAGFVAADTIRAMEERGIDIRDHFSKTIKNLGRVSFDLVIDITGVGIPEHLTGSAEVRGWDVEDPIKMSYEDHCNVRDKIEMLVMTLILELRRAAQSPKVSGQGSSR